MSIIEYVVYLPSYAPQTMKMFDDRYKSLIKLSLDDFFLQDFIVKHNVKYVRIRIFSDPYTLL